jgi:hypothetical protein
VKRDHRQRRIEALDPEVDFAEIYRIMGAHEFPWDITQALGLALYRTYAVPSIGELLAATGEFQNRTHKRYADTGLLLEAVIVIPMRRLDRFGWRRPTAHERRASVNYYRELGRHMNIKDSPATYPAPGRVTQALAVGGLRARAVVERRLPPRHEPHYVRQRKEFAIYPDGYTVDELGT